MDFNKYYLDQALGNSFPVYRGSTFQKGYGLGGVFRRFFSWALPLLKEHGLPLAKNLGKEIISNVASIASEAIDGKNVGESAKEKIKSSFEKLNQTGKGYKRRKKSSLKSKQKKKRVLDIFD